MNVIKAVQKNYRDESVIKIQRFCVYNYEGIFAHSTALQDAADIICSCSLEIDSDSSDYYFSLGAIYTAFLDKMDRPMHGKDRRHYELVYAAFGRSITLTLVLNIVILIKNYKSFQLIRILIR